MKENRKETGLEVAVIGMAGRFPGAACIAEFWNNLKGGLESIAFFTDDELKEAGVTIELLKAPNYVKAHGELQDKEYFDNSFFGYAPKQSESIDPQIRIFHECAWEALENAGYDPSSYNGSVGVYAGASDNASWRNLEMIKRLSEGQGAFGESVLNNALLFLSQSVSYKLDLTGPSLTLFTACSTSLVAVHLACRALITGECNMALAGGVSITATGKGGYLYQEGVILSPDGHCRAFDAKAKGTIFGEGVGVVVLKRLKDAVPDRDNIIAVIKGSSVNNDGIDKASFTAPSKKRIAVVVKKALAISQVEPDTITYVETHGTGTPLGDPIEIGSLTRAFNTGKKQFCRIGSAKTNIGHLDAAAGIAGFIKTALALKHKLIPPSLHFETPNPKIDFENSPFKVNTQLARWDKNDGYSLRAAVNSAGFGGTNAFVILEEAPGIEISSQSREWQILLLSARTEPALNKAAGNLAEFLKRRPNLNLADAAYTLKVGRKAFQYRRMLVCSDIDEAIDGLSSPGSGKIKTFLSKVENRDIIFMFPGQGSQYVNMCLELYRKEPVFGEEMDRCFDILKSIMGYDLKEILYPPGHTAAVEDRPALDINQTAVAQPLIFTIEYALAKLLIKWGIKPGALIGHSIGEYTAACLAGVFSLEDALAIVALRGKLMQQMPRGSMVSVALSLEKLEPLLNKTLSLAAVNGPSHCVVSGPDQAIEVFEQRLWEKDYKSTRLHTSHAFHSMMMDSILAQFEEAVSKFRLNKPGIPFISNLTGHWITAEEVTNPAYWASHLRRTVYFSEGLKELLEKDNSVFVEVGPGQVLSKLVKQHPDKGAGHLITNLVRHPKEDAADDYYLLDKIGMLWLYGIPIDWPGFYGNEKRHRIPLPTYPFERQRYRLEGDLFNKILEISTRDGLIGKKPDISDWFYIPLWKQAAPTASDNHTPGKQCCWLVFADTLGIGTRIADLLRKQEQDVVLVKIGTGFNSEKDAAGTYTYAVNPTRKTDYEMLFREIAKINKMPQRMVHLWSLSQNEGHRDNALTVERAVEAQGRGFYSLFYLVKGLQEENVMGSIHLSVVTNNVHSVCGEDYLLPEQSTVLGPVNVIPQEKPTISCSSIDIALPFKGEDQQQSVVEQLLAELLGEPRDKMVAFRDNRRWLPIYEPIRLPEPENEKAGLRQEGVYLVTGGLGNIGLVLAGYLARTVEAKLILTGRSAFPPRHEWDRWLTTHQQTDKVSQRIREIRKIEQLGGQVLVVCADTADEEQMKTAVSQAEEYFGPLNGVIHAAGVSDEKYFSLFGSMEKSQCEAQFQPKMQGLIVLQRVLEGKKLDFLVIMSSLSSILGGLGFFAYSAANIFMDGFLQQHNRKSTFPWLSVNWDSWQFNESELEILSMDVEEGVEAFKRILTWFREGRLIHSLGDLQARIDRWIKLKDLEQEPEPGEETVQSSYSRENLSSTFAAPRDPIEKEILDVWQNVFGFGNLGIYDDFFELGGDSLTVMTVSAKIHKRLKVEIPLTEFFNSPTIEKLAEFIRKSTKKSTYSFIESAEEKEYYPLSSTQKRLYILQQMEKETNISYNQIYPAVLEGEVEKDRMEETFKKLIERHESLRTSFEMIESEPVQKIHKNVLFKIEYHDVTGTQVEVRVKEITDNFIRPFDLSQAPLFRVGLIKLPGDGGAASHILVLDIHHIISDATSTALFLREFMSLYGGEQLPDLRLQYKDFSEWHNSKEMRESMKEQEVYWLKEFEGELPVLHLPTDFPRPVVQSFEGNTFSFEINTEDTAALKRYPLEQGTTLFMVLFAVYYIFLSKVSSQEAVVVGTPTAGRRHTDLEHIVGMFVNTLALKNDVPGEQPFEDILQKVKEKTLKAFQNQDYQFEELVDKVAAARSVGRNPLFDTMFSLQNFEYAEVEIAGLNLKPYAMDAGIAQFDLTLDIFEMEETLSCVFEYSTKLFREATIQRFVSYFKKIISIVGENPAIKIADIEILSEDEKGQILVDFNDTTAEYPKEKCLHQLFEEQVDKTPDGAAVVFEDRQLSYRALNARANRLALLLREKGVKAGTIVGMMVTPSEEMVIGLLAVLKAGGAYLPLTFDSPPERFNYILNDVNAAFLLTHAAGEETRIDFNRFNGLRLRIADEHLHEHSQVDNPAHVTTSGSLAYVIYTSGSTGRPKGVMVEHHSVVNLVFSRKKCFGMDEKDRVLQFSSIAFDASVEQVFIALCSGAVLVLIHKDTLLDSRAFDEFILRQSITHLDTVPSYLSNMSTRASHGLKRIISGGEACPPALANKWSEHCDFYNQYGPTETTVTSVVMKVEGLHETLTSLPIGKPIANTKVYLLEQWRQPVPLGVPGELYIGGEGVSRGYLNRPELTAERFIGFNRTYRSYKTGDLARWLPDPAAQGAYSAAQGAYILEFLGRVDSQVKLRGFRIELGEIENQLLEHETVKEAVVLVKEDSAGDKYLCAYFVSDKEVEISDLRGFLSENLPDYMIPVCFVRLETIPLTRSGKVNRRALPEPEFGSRAEAYTAPQNDIEKKLLEIWSEILALEKEKISVTANFFQLGGHSLKATVMVGKVHKELNVDLPLAEVFKTSTIKGLSEHIKGLSQYEYAAIEPVEKKEYYPLSSAQRRLYLLHGMNEQSITYNLPDVVMLEGDLDKKRLKNTFKRLIQRHESFRTSFPMVDREPVQRIHENVKFDIQYYHHTSDPLPLISQFIRPFDLSEAPLLRVGLITLPEKEAASYVLVFDMHHIISDGVSMGVIVNQFMTFYSGEDPPEPGIQYKDFSEWQNSKGVRESMKRQEAYWLKEFKDQVPVLHLPTDFTRPKVQRFEGKQVDFEIDKETTAALKSHALREGTTLFTLLLAVYNVFLSKLSTQEDLVVGTPIAGRRHSDLQHIVGMFVNTLALRNFPKGEKTFNQFLEDVKTRTVDAFSNQDYLYEDLVERVAVTRDPGRNPLFDTLFTLQNFDIPAIDIPGLTLKPYDYQPGISKFDLTLRCMEDGETLLSSFEYCTKLFKNATIERFTYYFKKILSTVIERPAINITNIEIMSESEKEQVLISFNDTAADYPKEKTLHRLFEEQVYITPDRTAVLLEDRQFSYGALNAGAGRLALALREKGVKPDIIIGLMVKRSPEMLIGMMGILKSGAAYLPIDFEYPEERKNYLLTDSGAGILVSEDHGAAPVNGLNKTIAVIDLTKIISPIGPIGPMLFKKIPAPPTQPAYIIYTSGSTGKPKGVMVEHRSVINLVYSQKRTFEIGETDRVLQFSSISFDASAEQIYITLLSGAALVLVAKMVMLDMKEFEKFIDAQSLTHIHAVPSFVNKIPVKRYTSLKRMVSGGDVCPLNLVKDWTRYCDFCNKYGPTETTVTSIQLLVRKGENVEAMSIGKALNNTSLYLLDRDMRPVPTGVGSELYIGGDGVARGYINRPELTAEVFKPNPFAEGGPIYKTGDMARWLPDGNMDFLGRIDNQVKLRGFRIESGEVENQLLKHEAVKEAVVMVREDEAGDKYLCAYVVMDKEMAALDLRDFLSGMLPDYMIPARFVPLETIPLNPSGKVDRKTLPAPVLSAEGDVSAPRNEIESKLADIWSEVLGIGRDVFGINSNFFQLGGHSLKATVMAAKIQKELQVDLSLVQVFTAPTIRELAQWITTAGKSLYAPIAAVAKKEYYDLTHAQERMWTLCQLADASIAYSIPMALLLEGKVDIPALERVFEALVERHESFRTVFVTINGEPKQKILAPGGIDFKVAHIDLEGDPGKETKARERLEQEAAIPFDLSRWPLLRVTLIRLEERKHIFFLNMHHIISDYVSFNIFIEEMLSLYGAFLEGKPNPLEPLRIQYKDYAQWHNEQLRGEPLKRHRQYWLNHLEGKLPRLELPWDKERPAVQTYNGDDVSLTFDEAFFIKLKTFSENNNVTLFMTLLTALDLLFYFYTGQTDILLGTVIAGREHADLRDQVGYYLNTLALRTRFHARDTFNAVLDDVKTVLTDAYQHQVYPFDQLVEDLGIKRDRARHSIFDVMVDMLNYNADHEETLHRSGSGNIRVENFDLQVATAHFDLAVIFTENKNTMDVSFEYNTDLFERTTIKRMVNRFKKLLDTALEEPGSVVSGLRLEKKVQAPMVRRISREKN